MHVVIKRSKSKSKLLPSVDIDCDVINLCRFTSLPKSKRPSLIEIMLELLNLKIQSRLLYLVALTVKHVVSLLLL